jgi:hypothetical protein
MNTDPTNSTRALDSDTLSQLAIEALERTAFVLADPCADPDALPSAEVFAQIEFHGPEQGGVDLAASRGFTRNLASSILGCDAAEVTDAQGDEALRELANILGGSVIYRLGGEQCAFSLGLPRLGSFQGWSGASGHESCVLDAEGERLEIRCHHRRAA